MTFHLIKRSSIVLFVLGLGAVPAAQAQVSWGLHAGVAHPSGTFADYFDLGPTVGFAAGYPLRERVALTVGGDFDHYNAHSYYGLPNVNLWRFQVGVLADLLGGSSEAWAVQAHAGAGGANLRSQREFYLESSTFGVDLDARNFAKTSLTGSGGLRLRFGGESRLSGFVGVAGFWANLGENATEVLRQTEPQTLKPLASALGYSVSAGFTMRP
jgi:hypothetical protein